MNSANAPAPLKVLLVQIRKDMDMLAPEQAGFIGLSGLESHQFSILDVYRQPDFQPDIIDDFQLLFIGGLSDDPSNTVDFPIEAFPFIDNLRALIRRAAALGKASLLSCGGFMIASEVLGGRVVIDPEREELGVYPICLTTDGLADPLFAGFPKCFDAISGHIKSTLETPPGCVLLASSQRCPVHAFRLEKAPFYAFQFHPEIRCEVLRARVERYKGKYFDSEEAYEKFISLMNDTTLANSIIRRFVELALRKLPIEKGS